VTLGVFVVNGVLILVLLVLIKRVHFVQIKLLDVLVLLVLMNWLHDLAVHVVIGIRIGQNDLELGVIADIELKFGGDVGVVNDSDWHGLVVAKSHSSEVNLSLFDANVGHDGLRSHRNSELLAASDVDKNFRVEVLG